MVVCNILVFSGLVIFFCHPIIGQGTWKRFFVVCFINPANANASVIGSSLYLTNLVSDVISNSPVLRTTNRVNVYSGNT